MNKDIKAEVLRHLPYVHPAIETVKIGSCAVMVFTSPGAGSGYDPTKPVDSKEGLFDGDCQLEIRSIWDE